VSAAVELVLSRLDDPKPSGRDRWRAACPCCGERNRSTLSVRVGDTGCVLLKCWKSGCEPGAIAAALGLELADLFPERREPGQGAGPLRRRRMVSAAQALELLDAESHFLWIVGSDWVRGQAPDAETVERLVTCVARIGMVRHEVAQ